MFAGLKFLCTSKKLFFDFLVFPEAILFHMDFSFSLSSFKRIAIRINQVYELVLRE